MSTRAAHILMCGDADFYQHIAVCLNSLSDSNPSTMFNVVVLETKGATAERAKLVQSTSNCANINLRIQDFDFQLVADLPKHYYYPQEIYARFWVADCFDDSVDRVIYLDGDMVVTGSIDPLLDLSLDQKILAAVQIPGSVRPRQLGYDDSYGYFNSGLMVINLEKWRSIGALGVLLNEANRRADDLNDPDQDLLNYCFHDRYVSLDYIWNAITPFFRSNNSLPLPQEEVKRVAREARIVHFNGQSKPWLYMCQHPMQPVYLKYLKKTEWRDFQFPDYSAINMFKRTTAAMLGERLSGIVGGGLRNMSKAVRGT